MSPTTALKVLETQNPAQNVPREGIFSASSHVQQKQMRSILKGDSGPGRREDSYSAASSSSSGSSNSVLDHILEVTDLALQNWFAELTGEELELAIRKVFDASDVDNTGHLDRYVG